jgi:hypothetical protein
MARSLPQDEELQRLPSLYAKFSNRAGIISLHGTTDNFSSYKDKIDFCNSVNNCKYKIIYPEEVDGHTFISSGHCFCSSSKDIFDYAMKTYNFDKHTVRSLDLQPVKYETSKYTYLFDYSSGVPILDRQKK